MTNPLPVMVSVKAPDPAPAEAGSIDAMDGVGLLVTANDTDAAVPPAGAGFTTVTDAVPPAAISVAVIAAVSCVALTYVVVRELPFHCTTDDGTNPVPVTDSVNVADPAAADDGEIPVIAGVGLLIVKVTLGEVPPPGAGFITTRLPVPPFAKSVAVSVTVICEPLRKVAVRLDPLY